MLDMQTVSETALPDFTPLDDDSVNGTRQLMKEAAKVHKQILQAAQDPKKFTKLDRDDPHEEAEDQKMLRLGYKYKLFKLDDGLVVCMRCQTHFHNDTAMEGLSNLFVLLEWNQKHQGWTKDLDAQTDVKFNKTIVENACNFNKWTMQCILDGVDKMRFAFVQRVDPESSRSHKVVGFNSLKPESFAAKLNLNIQNCWAVLKDVLVTILAQE